MNKIIIRKSSNNRVKTSLPKKNIVYAKNLKSVGVTYLLWLLFGIFGAHKFYLEKIGMGFLYLFTGGFFLIGLFTDLFTIPSQVKLANVIIKNN